MSLDQNLFTLFLTPNTAGGTVDLTDNSGTVHYRKRRVVAQQQQVYRIEVSDPLSEALLASATAPSATSKHKTLELYNPSQVVELKYTGTLMFRWSFKWETHEFEWKREECFMIRKPDPPVLVAVTKEPPGRIRTASVQILDYNLNRFDIEDRKGLEIVLLTALLTFQDSSDAYHEPNSSATSTPSASTTSPGSGIALGTSPPKPPPKPSPKKGVERIAELQISSGQVNEVTIFAEGAPADYAKHCSRLLQDDAMLFISVRSSDSTQVPKVLQVVEEAKRLRYKAGDPDLYQYVLYDTEGVAPQKGPRIINLDDRDGKSKNKEYTPPKTLMVHLSKIDMPELRPRGAPTNRRLTPPEHDVGKKKDKDSPKRVKDKPSNPSTSPPRTQALNKARSQFFQPTSTHQAPPLPPRLQPSQHSSGTSRRQSSYESPYGNYYHEDAVDARPANGTGSSTSGLLGRILGR